MHFKTNAIFCLPLCVYLTSECRFQTKTGCSYCAESFVMPFDVTTSNDFYRPGKVETH